MDSLRSTNHLPPNFIPKPARKRRRAWKWVILGVIILGALAWGGQYLLSRTNQIFTNNTNIFSRLGGLIISDDKPLIGEDQGTVNVLLLGYGGPGHEGPYLTDTMIVASINVKTQDVILTSIPRDFWVKLGSLGESKINAAYAYNISDTDPNAAGKAAIAAAEQVTGLDIPYFAAIDFQGFVKAVDHVGGLDITVDNSFTDDEYPDSNYGYMPVSFTKGPDHMDGARALIFARSRHGNNGEGSDFARSERQKKILLALKDKVFQLDLTDLKTMNNLLSDFTENFRTNLEPYELKRLGTLTQDISGDKVYSFSLEPQSNIICNGSIYLDPKTQKEVPAPSIAEPTPTPSDIAEGTAGEDNTATPTSDTAQTDNAESGPLRIYVVQPCSGKTLDDIHQLVQQSPILAVLKKENATIEIQNSTGKAAAAAPWQKLADLGAKVSVTPFRGSGPYSQTILYDNSKGTKPGTLQYLKDNFKFTTSDVGYPSSTADFFIFLGQDSQ